MWWLEARVTRQAPACTLSASREETGGAPEFRTVVAPSHPLRLEPSESAEVDPYFLVQETTRSNRQRMTTCGLG